MENIEEKTNKVSKEQAILEIQEFVLEHDERKKEDYEIENDFPHVIDAVMEGRVVFDEDKIPSLILKKPIKNDQEVVSLSEISFKTRIRPSELKTLMKGVKINENQVEYVNRAQSFLIKQPTAMLDRFGKADLKCIEQICSVFM